MHFKWVATHASCYDFVIKRTQTADSNTASSVFLSFSDAISILICDGMHLYSAHFCSIKKYHAISMNNVNTRYGVEDVE